MKLGASQSPVQSDTTVIITSVWGGAREPQSGLPDGAGLGRGGAGGGAAALGQSC